MSFARRVRAPPPAVRPTAIRPWNGATGDAVTIPGSCPAPAVSRPPPPAGPATAAAAVSAASTADASRAASLEALVRGIGGRGVDAGESGATAARAGPSLCRRRTAPAEPAGRFGRSCRSAAPARGRASAGSGRSRPAGAVSRRDERKGRRGGPRRPLRGGGLWGGVREVRRRAACPGGAASPRPRRPAAPGPGAATPTGRSRAAATPWRRCRRPWRPALSGSAGSSSG